MANRNSKQNAKLNLACKVQKGQSDPKNTHGGYAVLVAHERVKGVNVNSSKERAANGKKPWRGGTSQRETK
jgi:hypothetical protein